jgi:hypothetical protein
MNYVKYHSNKNDNVIPIRNFIFQENLLKDTLQVYVVF